MQAKEKAVIVNHRNSNWKEQHTLKKKAHAGDIWRFSQDYDIICKLHVYSYTHIHTYPIVPEFHFVSFLCCYHRHMKVRCWHIPCILSNCLLELRRNTACFSGITLAFPRYGTMIPHGWDTVVVKAGKSHIASAACPQVAMPSSLYYWKG